MAKEVEWFGADFYAKDRVPVAAKKWVAVMVVAAVVTVVSLWVLLWVLVVSWVLVDRKSY